MAKIGLMLMAGWLSLCPAFNTERVSAQDLSTVPELKEQWRTDIRTEIDGDFGDAGKYALRPTFEGELMSFCRKVVSNEVYSNGYPQECWEVVLLDRRSGKVQWESPTAKTFAGAATQYPLRPPVFGEERVYLITTDGMGSQYQGPKIRLNAYDLKTGAYLWECKLGRLGDQWQLYVKEDEAGVLVAMGSFPPLSLSGNKWTLYSCDRETGKVLWEKTGRWSNRPNTQAVDLSPAFVKIYTDQGGWAALKRQDGEVVLALDSHVQRGDKIYYADGGRVSARLEGSLDSLWQVETGIESSSWKPVPGKDELLWFQAMLSNFVGVTPEGKVAARMDLEAQAKIDQLKEPWVQEGILYGLSKDQKRIYALRPAAGEVVWQWAPTEKKGPKISATILDGRFALVSWEGGMGCLETSGGRELWRRDSKGYTLLDKDEKEMLWSVEPDQIAGLNLQDGNPVWTTALPGDNTPIEVKGRFLVAFNYLKAEKMLQMVFLNRHHGNALGRLVLDLVPIGTLIEGDMLYFWALPGRVWVSPTSCGILAKVV